jgi:hypothetical protein
MHRVLTLAALVLPLSAPRADMPAEIAAPGQTPIAAVHAEGVQLYECRTQASGKLVWEFREPIATLIMDGKTVGRHYAGPNWELSDGSAVAAKVVAHAPGATPRDIARLRLDVVSQRGSGLLSTANTVQRLNTRGGVAEGACQSPGTLLSVPYSADYIFYRKVPFL